MQDRYAGDVGDFGKFGLLKAVRASGMKVGINWYKVLPPSFEISESGIFKNNDGKHKISKQDALCDPELADALNSIFVKDAQRSVELLERAALIDDAVYFSKPTPVKDRPAWHTEAIHTFRDCDIVFLDPDNGLLPEKTSCSSTKSVKYVFDEEIHDYLAAEKSVICYQHRKRIPPADYFAEMEQRLRVIGAECGTLVVTFRRGTVRDYFLIPATEAHKAKMEVAIDAMNLSAWGNSDFFHVQPFPYVVCPACGNDRLLPILYGNPSAMAANLADAGKLELGGCCVFDGRPQWKCQKCGQSF